MTCPFCQSEMLSGYLNCANAIWSQKKHKFSTLPNSQETYALHLDVPALFMHTVDSYCCPRCKKIILDAAEYRHNLD